MSTPIDDAVIRRLADMHAVYRMFDAAGHLLYIGRTGRAGRFDEHAVKRWFPLVTTITLEWHATAAQAALAERRAISAERPRYNRAGTRPPKKAMLAKMEKAAAEPTGPRDLLADLDAVMGTERVRLSELPARLRQIAPGWEPYKKLTGVQLKAILKERGVRVVTKANVPRLDPADLRQKLRRPAA